MDDVCGLWCVMLCGVSKCVECGPVELCVETSEGSDAASSEGALRLWAWMIARVGTPAVLSYDVFQSQALSEWLTCDRL